MVLSRRQFASVLGSAALLRGAEHIPGWTVRDGPESAFYMAEGEIVASPASAYPAWLATEKQYENFELTFEFFLKGWIDGGLYLHAPEHGRPSTCGLKVNIFHQRDAEPKTNSMGAVSLVAAPLKADAHKEGWNRMRVLCDWPVLRVFINDMLVQDLKLDAQPELSRRLRRGYIGLSAISYPLRVRSFEIKELAPKWQPKVLFNGAADMSKWSVTESNERSPAQFRAYGRVLRADGLGDFTTKETFADFDLQMYVRGAWQHNGGVLFRYKGKTRYEIQLHDVEEAHYPTGSLYFHKRARYPRIAPEQWFLFQLLVQGPRCQVRIDGETVMEYDKLEDLGAGGIALQAHQAGRWLEYKEILVRSL
jgi:hypothetical protein